MLKNALSLLFILFALPIWGQELYIKGDTNPYSCDQFDVLLSDNLSKSDSDILFFVHGRGRHPEKGLKYLPTFEKNFNLKIIMFDWDSWISEITRPEKNAKQASESLGQCLVKLQNFKLKNAKYFAKRNLYFMIHSMGNIVLQNYLQNYYSSHKLLANLFDAMIMNAPDIETKDHSQWLLKIDFSKSLYISYNHDDAVLIGSKAIDYKDLKFGRGTRLGAYIGDELSLKATYLDFSKISLGGHEHFLEDQEHKITKIFNNIFHDNSKFEVEFTHDKKQHNVLHFR